MFEATSGELQSTLLVSAKRFCEGGSPGSADFGQVQKPLECGFRRFEETLRERFASVFERQMEGEFNQITLGLLTLV